MSLSIAYFARLVYILGPETKRHVYIRQLTKRLLNDPRAELSHRLHNRVLVLTVKNGERSVSGTINLKAPTEEVILFAQDLADRARNK